ncbi:hypothetical protein AOL_s00007g384 [Orbilia oligospora ATCC 24927]|uniref:Uncharacterized protein n=1 Tax=Arthrobotrys oligospora (strain ATCC 24927 / CBS 115.81 / DSM 1491) TaxID=756982 RepID=G1X275_ARTOA|nr:hypothetical protein AOL_s00007g384 [Orbilia oligospora ATCC 24927]EGX53048.1 hypothetical protein AOL_s00007g384 [Orbilia oligospora ATCC 24927]
MRTSTILSLLLTATAISAAPIPNPQNWKNIGAGVVNGIGFVCTFQGDQCQQIGDAVKNGLKDSVTKGPKLGEKDADKVMKGGLKDTISGWNRK